MAIPLIRVLPNAIVIIANYRSMYRVIVALIIEVETYELILILNYLPLSTIYQIKNDSETCRENHVN